MLQARHTIPVRTVKGECIFEARVINSRITGQHEQTVSLAGKLRIKNHLLNFNNSVETAPSSCL